MADKKPILTRMKDKMVSALSGQNTPYIDELVRMIMSPAVESSLEAALDRVHRMQPSSDERSYREEMNRRTQFLKNNQHGVMKDELKERYPQGYKESNLKSEQVNLPVYSGLKNDQAQVLKAPGEFTLIDKNGDPVNDKTATENMNAAFKLAKFHSTLQDGDLKTHTYERSCFRAWWDPTVNAAQADFWEPQLVNVVADPWLSWSVDAAPAVLFELPRVDLTKTTTCRYEVFAKHEIDGVWKTLHFYIHEYNDKGKLRWTEKEINADFVIPFEDPRTGDPLYPFVWWRGDADRAIYIMANTDSVETNVTVNCQNTDLGQHIKFKGGGLNYIKVAEGEGDVEVPGVLNVGPFDLPTLPSGCSIESVPLDMIVPEVQAWLNEYLRSFAKMSGQNPNIFKTDTGAAESGYKYQLEMIPVTENREKKLPYYIPDVEESGYRFLIVHDTYADKELKVGMAEKGYLLQYKPGELAPPVDAEAQRRTDALDISMNLTTPVQILMRDNPGMTEEQAKKEIDENAEFNRSMSESKMLNLDGRPGFSEDEPEAVEPEEEEETEDEGEEK